MPLHRNRMDINCDMGESFGNWKMGNDSGMLPYITTANVACGFHASDPLTMLDTVRQAEGHGVVIGAHPGLPDLLGFGRRAMAITPEDAYAYVVYQVGALQGALRIHGLNLHHIKPHGAFFWILRVADAWAKAVAESIAQLSDVPVLYWPSPTDSALPSACKKLGIRVVGEIYPDLEYAADGSLILQRAKHETDPEAAADQVESFVTSGQVKTVDGTLIPMDAESLCIHGDGPNCVEVAEAICSRLKEVGCDIKPATS